MNHLRVSISKKLKRVPAIFDMTRRATRIFGARTPIYNLLVETSKKLPDVAFIQIGSNDGISVDPLREFIVSNHKWHGAFVEPVPQIFTQLCKNYSYLRGRDLNFFNVAVAEQPGTKSFWKIKDACLKEFPLFAYQIGSFDRDHITKHFPDISDMDSKIEEINVPCRTYEEIRREAGLSDVHVLHMDVEGYECHILRSIDFDSSKPRIILFEVSHMSNSTKHGVFTMLRDHGYVIQDVGIDCIAMRSGVGQPLD